MKKIIGLVLYLIGELMLLAGVWLFIHGLIEASFAINYNVGLIVSGLLLSAIGYKLMDMIGGN